MDELHYQSATTLARALRDGRLGARELLEHFLVRIDRHNPALNALVWQDREGARARADAADAARARGEPLGPLHGLPMTIKESYNLAGAPSTWGVPELRGNLADEDALAVQRLKAAGANVFGKTNVPLRLADFQSYNDIYGTTENPWCKGRTPGGSSGGSAAALAAGLTGLEIGSDIGGSIRNPAHFCGVFGHKPTWGLLPPRGHALGGALSPTDISVIGPLARSADDLETALRLMAGPDALEAAGLQLDLPELDTAHRGVEDRPAVPGVGGGGRAHRRGGRGAGRAGRGDRRGGAAGVQRRAQPPAVFGPAGLGDVGPPARRRLRPAGGPGRGARPG
jgi:amidase